jgi:ArsR family transcriptional regulator
MDKVMQLPRCARMLRSLADSDRLRIIECLREGPKNVSEIADLLSSTMVKVSHHLGILRHARVVLSQKHGRFVVYRLHPAVYQPAAAAGSADSLILGGYRLEFPNRKGTPYEARGERPDGRARRPKFSP